MDPLSLTASIIAVVTAAAAVLRTLESIKERKGSSPELSNIINTVTALQATLVSVRHAEAALRDGEGQIIPEIHNTLKEALEKAQISLDRLVEFADQNLSRPNGKTRLFGLDGKRRKLFVEIKESISESHRNLQMLLISANLHQSASIREVVLVQHNHQTETAVQLENIREILSCLPSSRPSQVPRALSNSSHETQTSIATRNAVQSISQSSQIVRDTSEIRITTSVRTKSCDPQCPCQCHVRARYRTPGWLSTIVGTLFYESSHSPSIAERPCNFVGCKRSQTSSNVNLTYYFPVWLLRSAVVYATWSNLSGTNSSWTVRMPRENSDQHYSWKIIRGNVHEFQRMLSQRIITPYDVSTNGEFILHYACRCSRWDIARILITAGADVHLNDRHGRSPSDTIWQAILGEGPESSWVAELRGLVTADYAYDLQLTPLHKIILRFSSANLEEQINLAPSILDDRDWMGMTALMWASNLDRADHVRTLLAQGAKADHANVWGTHALHFATKRGSFNSMVALIEAGADPNVTDFYGETPLHHLCSSDQSSSIVAFLVDHGANIEAQNCFGRTPFFKAVSEGRYDSVISLVEHGAEINYIDDKEMTLLLEAITMNDATMVGILCKLGARVYWETISHGEWNIPMCAARWATATTMQELAALDFAPVRKNPNWIIWIFRHRRSQDIVRGDNSYKGESYEEELGALMFLIERKIILDGWKLCPDQVYDDGGYFYYYEEEEEDADEYEEEEEDEDEDEDEDKETIHEKEQSDATNDLDDESNMDPDDRYDEGLYTVDQRPSEDSREVFVDALENIQI